MHVAFHDADDELFAVLAGLALLQVGFQRLPGRLEGFGGQDDVRQEVLVGRPQVARLQDAGHHALLEDVERRQPGLQGCPNQARSHLVLPLHDCIYDGLVLVFWHDVTPLHSGQT